MFLDAYCNQSSCWPCDHKFTVSIYVITLNEFYNRKMTDYHMRWKNGVKCNFFTKLQFRNTHFPAYLRGSYSWKNPYSWLLGFKALKNSDVICRLHKSRFYVWELPKPQILRPQMAVLVSFSENNNAAKERNLFYLFSSIFPQNDSLCSEDQSLHIKNIFYYAWVDMNVSYIISLYVSLSLFISLCHTVCLYLPICL